MNLLIFIYFFSLILLIGEISSENKFRQKIDYNNCITNLACSIEKYFDITPRHKTLSDIDNLLEEKQPENVVLLLADGLGSRILDKVLNKDDFLIKQRKREIFSVFPPTTSADLTSIKTGLNPAEHGWVGWTAYFQPLNKIMTLYKDYEKGKKGEIDEEFAKLKEKYFNTKSIVDLINEEGKYSAYEISCYPYNVDKDIDSVFNKVLEKIKIKGKKYIFAYYPEPDTLLHNNGVNSEEARTEIKKINKKVEEYSKLILETNNTVMIMVADHGHLLSDIVPLQDWEFTKYMEISKTFIETRSPAFLIKKGEEENFKNAFIKELGKEFYLLSKEEVIESGVFGDYEEKNKHELFESSIGDFMAFSKDSSKLTLIAEGDNIDPSYHGGYSDDELYIPLIVISN